MKREHTRLIGRILDEWIPPVIRERRWFYRMVLSQVVRGDVESYLDFRENVWKMSDVDLQRFYSSIRSNIDRPTDCNNRSINRIMSEILSSKPRSILEFGCGRGYVAKKILNCHGCEYTGLDFDTSKACSILPDNVRLIDAVDLDVLGSDEKFDCVLCTHTLEHVTDVKKLFGQLMERSTGLIIIVVPLQLNLRYSADLHTRFWRSPGDFFLDAGVKPWMMPDWYVDQDDLFLKLDISSGSQC